VTEQQAPDDAWPERFVPGAMSGVIEAEHTGRYAWVAPIAAGRRTLDAGCGVGYGAAMLARAGAASVVGADIDPAAIAQARQREPSAEFIVADVSEMPFDDAEFELAVCFEAIEHVVDQDKALDELRRVLAPGGVLAISSPNRGVYEPGNPHHTREFTPDELSAALCARFKHVTLYRQHAWMATLIGDEFVVRTGGVDTEITARVRKLERLQPGEETFTVAIASDVSVPALESLVALTDTRELDAWQERARSAEVQFESASAYAVALRAELEVAGATPLLAQARAERDAARDRARQADRARELAMRAAASERAAMAAMSAAMSDARELEQQLRVQVEVSERRLAAVTNSKSWRMTALLRALMETRRRGSS
jgi:2-polyprenyl-3-methyl-5-hydroxy-6-metoxy-1,4-benzoquinol methylase